MSAALDSGQFTPNSILSGRSPQTIGGVPLTNANNDFNRAYRKDYSTGPNSVQVVLGASRG